MLRIILELEGRGDRVEEKRAFKIDIIGRRNREKSSLYIGQREERKLIKIGEREF